MHSSKPMALALLLLAVCATSTAAQLDADFTASVTQGINPLLVTFTDTSVGATPLTWSWEFGDGAFSTLQNPTHSYMAPGTHSVSLTKTEFITVDPAFLNVDFTADQTRCSHPLEVTFTNRSQASPPTSWLWEFGDGTTSSEANPVHVFQAGRTHSFDVSLTGFAGELSETKLVADLITVTPGAFGFEQVIGSSAAPINAIQVGDIDGDGDVDLLVVSRTLQKLSWYENLDGSGSFGAAQLLSIETAFPSTETPTHRPLAAGSYPESSGTRTTWAAPAPSSWGSRNC